MDRKNTNKYKYEDINYRKFDIISKIRLDFKWYVAILEHNDAIELDKNIISMFYY